MNLLALILELLARSFPQRTQTQCQDNLNQTCQKLSKDSTWIQHGILLASFLEFLAPPVRGENLKLF